MSKQLKKYCHITKYIEKTDPKLYEILDDLCVLGMLRPRKGNPGLTFLYPSKETIKKLGDMRYTDKIEDAIEIILCHIVYDYLPNYAAWNKKDDISNANRKKIEVAKVGPTGVTINGGVELHVNTKFKTFSFREESQMIYDVSKGQIDPAKFTKQAKPAVYQPGKKVMRVGGYYGGNALSDLPEKIKEWTRGPRKSSSPELGKLAKIYANIMSSADDAKKDTAKLVFSDAVYTTACFLANVGNNKYTPLNELEDDIKLDDYKPLTYENYLVVIYSQDPAKELTKVGGGYDIEDSYTDEQKEHITNINSLLTKRYAGLSPEKQNFCFELDLCKSIEQENSDDASFGLIIDVAKNGFMITNFSAFMQLLKSIEDKLDGVTNCLKHERSERLVSKYMQ